MLAHNGNLVNAHKLREEMEYTGAIFHTTIDTEVIAYLIARERLHTPTAEEAVKNAMMKLQGAYSLIISSPRKLIGARDPYGFRPLVIGKRDNSYILASETCALDAVDAEFVRDVLPGEIVMLDKDGIQSDDILEHSAKCIFEYIYFARPDSYVDGVSVYNTRIMAGKILAHRCIRRRRTSWSAFRIPEMSAAMGFALAIRNPIRCTAFVKNSYVGRTFIKPKQSARESSVKIKLNVLKEVVRGKTCCHGR